MIILAGVDEVGRGSLIGPVYAAAVILNNSIDKKLLKDSKTLTKDRREELEKYIKKNSIWAIGQASTKEIEKINILHASLLAMKRAILKLKTKPSLVLIDGNKLPDLKNYKLKVSRDKFITKLSKEFNDYGWDTNSGYGTKEHLKAIKQFGITKYHRKTFSPISDLL
jgi:ribonuclease HII